MKKKMTKTVVSITLMLSLGSFGLYFNKQVDTSYKIDNSNRSTIINGGVTITNNYH